MLVAHLLEESGLKLTLVDDGLFLRCIKSWNMSKNRLYRDELIFIKFIKRARSSFMSTSF